MVPIKVSSFQFKGMVRFEIKSPTCIHATGSAKHFFCGSAATANTSCETAGNPQSLMMSWERSGCLSQHTVLYALSHTYFDYFSCKGRERSWRRKVFNSLCLHQHNLTAFVLIIPNYDLEQYKFQDGCKSPADLCWAGGELWGPAFPATAAAPVPLAALVLSRQRWWDRWSQASRFALVNISSACHYAEMCQVMLTPLSGQMSLPCHT